MSFDVLGAVIVSFQFLTKRENVDCVRDGPIWRNKGDGWRVHHCVLYCNWWFLMISRTRGLLRIFRKLRIPSSEKCTYMQYFAYNLWKFMDPIDSRIINLGQNLLICCLSAVSCLTYSFSLSHLYLYLSVSLSIYIFSQPVWD